MKTYKLTKDRITQEIGPYALELIDGIPTGVNIHRELNVEYLEWLAEGNEPLPADETS